jgi:hypothetical protein
MLKLILNILGVLLFLAGAVWFFQGVGVLPGSYMSGQMQWAINGTVTMLVGVALLVIANRPGRKTPPSV